MSFAWTHSANRGDLLLQFLKDVDNDAAAFLHLVWMQSIGYHGQIQHDGLTRNTPNFLFASFGEVHPQATQNIKDLSTPPGNTTGTPDRSHRVEQGGEIRVVMAHDRGSRSVLQWIQQVWYNRLVG